MPITERLNPSFGTARPPAQGAWAEARKRLIVALDVPDAAGAANLVDQLENTCQWFKVGMELFVAAGPAVLRPLVARGHSVFLDLKFHDIPNTVTGAVRSAAALGVRMITVHAGGGPAMLAAARAALEGVENPPELLAVTMLTSMDQAQMSSTGLERSPAEQVELLARMGLEAGIRGFVCSPQEVQSLRSLTGPEGVLVVPGIRPAGAETGDQKRIATPGEALLGGASYLVVGRPITQAPDPAEAAAAILKEMAVALETVAEESKLERARPSI
jgi:orotidine-5'-phosphate decarboxylase